MDPPDSPYAAPRSETEEPYGLGARVGWAPLAAIAAGMVESIAWTIYVDLMIDDTVRVMRWVSLGLSLVVWGSLTTFLVSRFLWARAACRVAAVLWLLGGLLALRNSGSILFFLAVGLRIAIYAALFVLLRPPPDNRPPPIWMQPP